MELLEAYLDRKYEELKLLDGFLGTFAAEASDFGKRGHPTEIPHCGGVESRARVARLGADRNCLGHPVRRYALVRSSSAMTISARDLEVRGPSFYQLDDRAPPTKSFTRPQGCRPYRRVLLASAPGNVRSGYLGIAWSYGETVELIETMPVIFASSGYRAGRRTSPFLRGLGFFCSTRYVRGNV